MLWAAYSSGFHVLASDPAKDPVGESGDGAGEPKPGADAAGSGDPAASGAGAADGGASPAPVKTPSADWREARLAKQTADLAAKPAELTAAQAEVARLKSTATAGSGLTEEDVERRASALADERAAGIAAQ